MTTSASTYKAKQALRKQIRSSLSTLTHDELSTQSTQVWEQLFQLPQYNSESCKSIGLFISMPKGEISTDEACRKVLDDGKTLYVPRCGLDFEQCDMDLIRVPSSDASPVATTATSTSSLASTGSSGGMFYKDWPRNKWGIPEAPRSDEYKIAQPGDIDLLIVPGLGFDRNGGRLGQGKGYYDRFITNMRSTGTGKPLLVAVGLEPSFVSLESSAGAKEEENGDGEGTVRGIPMMDHDHKMDMTIVPNETIICPK